MSAIKKIEAKHVDDICLEAVKHCQENDDAIAAIICINRQDAMKALNNVEYAWPHKGDLEYRRSSLSLHARNGSRIEFHVIDCRDSYFRLHGRAFSFIGIRDVGEYSEEIIERLYSTFRPHHFTAKDGLICYSR